MTDKFRLDNKVTVILGVQAVLVRPVLLIWDNKGQR